MPAARLVCKWPPPLSGRVDDIDVSAIPSPSLLFRNDDFRGISSRSGMINRAERKTVKPRTALGVR